MRRPARLLIQVMVAVVTTVLISGAAVVPADAAVYPCSLAWGLFETNIPWDTTMAELRTIDTEVGRHSAIVHWYAQWGGSSGVFATQRPLLEAVRGYTSVGVTGSLPLITWEPWGPRYTPASADFPLTEIAGGRFDNYIDSWGRGLRSYGAPVLLDFGHEMNGNWYPWGYGVNGNTPSSYVAAFRHVRSRFAATGATNVQFVWNPDAWSPSGISAAVFYPGDASVDWMGIDAYNWNASWSTLAHELRGVYSQLAPLNAAKPMMLAEVASQSQPPAGADPVSQAAWISLAAVELVQHFPRVSAVVWFNREGSQLALDGSAASLAATTTAFGTCAAGGQRRPALGPSAAPPGQAAGAASGTSRLASGPRRPAAVSAIGPQPGDRPAREATTAGQPRLLGILLFGPWLALATIAFGLLWFAGWKTRRRKVVDPVARGR